METTKVFVAPFQCGDGKIYPAGRYSFTLGQFAQTLRNVDEPQALPQSQRQWNHMSGILVPLTVFYYVAAALSGN